MSVQQLIDQAKSQVKRIVSECQTDSRTVIARYTAAVKVNFTDWMGKTIPWLRDWDAKHATVKNLECEQREDHVGMLQWFAQQANALPDREHYAHVLAEETAIRQLFTDPTTAGLLGVMLLTILENTSEVFIPDLARRGKECGVTDFIYTDVHGVADVEHSQAFIEATVKEQAMGYQNPEPLMTRATLAAVALIAKVYA